LFIISLFIIANKNGHRLYEAAERGDLTEVRRLLTEEEHLDADWKDMVRR
jgi:hypothetical protein